jgi:uncharacterized protein
MSDVTRSKPWLWFECLALFAGVPIALTVAADVVRPLPVLGVVLVGVLIVLWRDPTFDRGQVFRRDRFGSQVVQIVGLWLAAAIVLGIGMWWYEPRALFRFPMERPGLWMMVMVLYPVFSVVPQTVIYRAFFFHRYRDIFRSRWTMIVAGTVAFALGHVIFKNAAAVGLTAAGGLIFCWRFDRTRSLLISAIEHALYGQLIFTLGYGLFLFHGRLQLMQQMQP